MVRHRVSKRGAHSIHFGKIHVWVYVSISVLHLPIIETQVFLSFAVSILLCVLPWQSTRWLSNSNQFSATGVTLSAINGGAESTFFHRGRSWQVWNALCAWQQGMRCSQRQHSAIIMRFGDNPNSGNLMSDMLTRAAAARNRLLLLLCLQHFTCKAWRIKSSSVDGETKFVCTTRQLWKCLGRYLS